MQSITYLKTAAYRKVFGTDTGAIHLPCMRIVNELPVLLSTNTDMISITVMQAIRNNIPAVKICQTLAEMANDNFIAVANLIGDKMTIELINLFDKHLVTFVKSRPKI